MATFEKELKVNKVDTYSLTVDSEWLEGESIASHDVTVDSLVSKDASIVDGNKVAVKITGISEGSSILHFSWVTSSGRSDCDKATVKVVADC